MPTSWALTTYIHGDPVATRILRWTGLMRQAMNYWWGRAPAVGVEKSMLAYS